MTDPTNDPPDTNRSGHGSHDASHHRPLHAHGAHGHTHAPADFGIAFTIGTALNLGFVLAEIIGGLSVHSMALIGDAGHNLGDVLGLVLAWVAAAAGRRAPTRRYTYGYGRGTILAALINAALLLVSVGAIAVEAIRRLVVPEPTVPIVIAIVAAIGVAVNGATALLFARGRSGELNLRGVFAHMAADALISAGVVVAAGAIWLTGWQRIDPLVSLLLAGLIAWTTRTLLRDSLTLSLDAVPPGIDAAAVRRYLASLPGVVSIHDLHVWSMSTTRAALTCHIVTASPPETGFLGRACSDLHALFGIDHSTLQLEHDGRPCVLEPEHLV